MGPGALYPQLVYFSNFSHYLSKYFLSCCHVLVAVVNKTPCQLLLLQSCFQLFLLLVNFPCRRAVSVVKSPRILHLRALFSFTGHCKRLALVHWPCLSSQPCPGFEAKPQLPILTPVWARSAANVVQPRQFAARVSEFIFCLPLLSLPASGGRLLTTAFKTGKSF